MLNENIVVILLFIIPGIIAERISYRMDMPSSYVRSEFGEFINSVLFSLPIIAVTCYYVGKHYEFSTINEFIGAFQQIDFLIYFAMRAIKFAVITGLVVGLSKDNVIRLINLIRRGIFGKIKIDDKSCWRKAFLESKDPKYLEVTYKGQTHVGFADCYSLPNEEKEILLYIPENWDDYPELKDSIKRIEKTYINLEKDIVIRDYDIKEHNKINEKLKENINV